MVGIEGRPEMPATPPGEMATIEREAVAPRILEIYTSPHMGIPMEVQTSVHAIAGRGLQGDRYASRTGAYSAERIGKPGRIPDEDRQVSLISAQGITEANAALVTQGIAPFSHEETRRNLITDLSVDALNELVGKRFMVGNVVMEGTELCTPCTRPAIVLKRKEDGKPFEEAFENRGGLRARIITEGDIIPSDTITII